jgi:TatD DNase family protein
MIIDTHCHYNLNPLLTDWQQHWSRAQQHGIHKTIIVGADLVSSKQGLLIAEQDNNLFAAVGIHPDVALDANLAEQLSQLEKLANQKNKKLVAIGEIGLDYFHFAADSDRAKAINLQQQLFQSQLELANQLQLPAIVHVRDRELPAEPTSNNAYWDTLQLIKEHYLLAKPFVLHCVSGPTNYIKQAVDLGAFIGIAGNVTYKNAFNIREIVQLTPSDRLLVETDAPYLPPVPYRGQTCDPWMITETVKYLVENLGVDEAQLQQNAINCFQLPS